MVIRHYRWLGEVFEVVTHDWINYFVTQVGRRFESQHAVVFHRGFSDFTEALEEYYRRIVKFQTGVLTEWETGNQDRQATPL
jgi:hypothetical protein